MGLLYQPLMIDEWGIGLGETPVPVPLFPYKFHKDYYETESRSLR
jgi:hypothetical protein